MSKDTGGFLRKVVRFVANPTTDWSQLDSPTASESEDESTRSELRAMIERKRRNDFVRKRELDMLRKIRREGLNPEAAMLAGSISNLDSESRPQTGARSDIAVKAKIDEIEQQMVGVGSSPRQTPLAEISAAQLAPTEPGQLTPLMAERTRPQDLAFSAKDRAPQHSPYASTLLQEPDPHPILANLKRPSGSTAHEREDIAPYVGGREMGEGGIEVTELLHDPELDEAVIAFANADFDACEEALRTLIAPGASRETHPETWLVLFDLYRVLDQHQDFENLALSYARRFGVSAPQWYSLPARIASHEHTHAGSTHSSTMPLSMSAALDGPDDAAAAPAPLPPAADWCAPAQLDDEAVTQLRSIASRKGRPLRLDLSHTVAITAQGADQLCAWMEKSAMLPGELHVSGLAACLNKLEQATPSGLRDVDPALWLLRLEMLRWAHQAVAFDEVAIDFCVTYERSPPSWEATVCKISLEDSHWPAPLSAQTQASIQSTSFPESEIMGDSGLARLQLCGQLIGDIGKALSLLDDQMGERLRIEIDCQHLLRVDFLAAGDLLNWVLSRVAEQRHIDFVNPHRLVALFFAAMGINEHARIKASVN